MARANGCSVEPIVSDASLDQMSITRLAWTGCDAQATVALYRVNGGRHQVLGRKPIFPAIFGGRRQQVSAAETIMATFAGE